MNIFFSIHVSMITNCHEHLYFTVYGIVDFLPAMFCSTIYVSNNNKYCTTFVQQSVETFTYDDPYAFLTNENNKFLADS